jgi:hypothetical protein
MTAATAIAYADTLGSYKLYRRPVARRGGVLGLLPGQGVDGYGRKITTDLVLVFDGETRERRVYATCFSNAASHWITHNGRTLWLRCCETVEEG